MGHKCFLCEKPAEYTIKNATIFYCKGCAVEQFASIEYLQKLEQEAKAVEAIVEEKLNSE